MEILKSPEEILGELDGLEKEFERFKKIYSELTDKIEQAKKDEDFVLYKEIRTQRAFVYRQMIEVFKKVFSIKKICEEAGNGGCKS